VTAILLTLTLRSSMVGVSHGDSYTSDPNPTFIYGQCEPR